MPVTAVLPQLDRSGDKVNWNMPPAQASYAAAAATDTQTNTAATVTVAGITGVPIIITGLSWAYQGTVTPALLTIKDGSTVIWQATVGAGFGSYNFPLPRAITAGNNLVVNLPAGGSAVVGTINVEAFYLK
jgi:hypothetical protein